MDQITYKVAETESERKGHFAVRHEVFVEEQGIFEGTDRDEYDEGAIHLISVDTETGDVVGAVRCYEEKDDVWIGGRLAVVESYRHLSIGSELCKLAEETVLKQGARRFLAYIQPQNVPFFEHLGWSKVGEPVDHCGMPHQMMEAPLVGIEKSSS